MGRDLRSLYLGLKSTACAVSTPYGVERNLRLLYLGAEKHGLRREYACRRGRDLRSLTWGLKSTACAVSTPYGVERNLRSLDLGLTPVGLSRAKQGKLCPRSPLGQTMSSLISPLKSIINAFLNG